MLPLLLAEAAPAATRLHLTYEVTAETDVVDDNYAKGRKKAVAAAMREAVKMALEELLGEQVYEAEQRALRKIVSQARRYVRSYRFLYADDDFDLMIAEVKLEVSLYTEALRKKLRALGALTGPGGERTVVILTKETRFAGSAETAVGNARLISEMAIVEKFLAAGIQVVRRSSIRGLITEEMIANAAKGDIEAAVDIGLKTGADTVIVGNSVSSLMPGDATTDPTVRANISLKAVSASQSVIIAAKSDFAVATGEDAITAEAAAFEEVSIKLSAFLLDSIRQFWEKKPDPSPAPKTPVTSPHPITDL